MKFLILVLCFSFVFSLPSKQNLGGRIIGGTLARSGQFPFAAAIYTTTPDGNYFCGGALVSDQWILTAGQCVDGVTTFNVHLGSNLLNGRDQYAVRVSSDTYVLHPEYNPLTLDNDIGLIYLRVPVEFSDYLKPVDFLPTADLEKSDPVLATGWGQIGDDAPGLVNELRCVDVVVLSNQECSLVYGNQITESMVCVDGPYNEGTCIGDSGSPLVQTVGIGHSVVVGISSFLSQNGCETIDPSGFTRVFPYNDWIRNTTGRT